MFLTSSIRHRAGKSNHAVKLGNWDELFICVIDHCISSCCSYQARNFLPVLIALISSWCLIIKLSQAKTSSGVRRIEFPVAICIICMDSVWLGSKRIVYSFVLISIVLPLSCLQKERNLLIEGSSDISWHADMQAMQCSFFMVCQISHQSGDAKNNQLLDL